jgi:hypothetical protein
MVVLTLIFPFIFQKSFWKAGVGLAFKGDAQNLPLRRVGRGEVSPLAVPRG